MGKNRGIIITLISLLFVIGPIFRNKELYTEKFDPAKFQNKYNQSQWVIPNSKNIISDEDLYTIAAYKYVNGLNPILINPETPPLGKYLIGTSIILFKNQRITSIIAALLCLMIIFHIILFTTKSYFISSIAVLLTSLNTLFIDQIIHAPQLDIFQLLFFLLFIIFYLLFRNEKKLIFFLFSALAIGYFISAKFFLVSFVIMNSFFLIYYLISKQSVKKILIQITAFNLLSILIYAYTYTGYFMLGGSPRGFLGVQKWIFTFYSGSRIDISQLLGNYLSLIFLNRWKFWTEGYPIIHYQYWSILWPIIFILSIYSAIKLFRTNVHRIKDLTLLLISFLITYNLFLFMTPVFPRYLLLLFVPMNILVALYFGRIIENKL